MTLSTVDELGQPDARMLILKDVDESGWQFAVKKDSPKGKQVSSSKTAALTFYWPLLARQVRIRGVVNQLTDAACQKDFAARPRDAKIAAVASKQSQPVKDREEVLRAVREAKDSVPEDTEIVMDAWKVMAVAPLEVEFWQGSEDRLHHRIKYSFHKEVTEKWEKQMLWP